MRKTLLALAILTALMLVLTPVSDAQITTQVVTETGTQTLTNKTIPASNTVTINWADITDVSVLLTELAELEAIGAVTISANQWAVLGGIAETLTAAELDLLDGITVLSGSNTGDAAETNNLETNDPPNVADTEIYIGTGAGAGAWAVISGDGTLANNGALTVVDDSHAHVITNIDSFTAAQLQTQTSDVTTFYTEDTTVPVADGGTGASTLTDGGMLFGSGTGAITALGVATNGQIPIGDGTTDPVLATITGTANEITVTNGAGSITIDIPTDPTLSGANITGIVTAGITDDTILEADLDATDSPADEECLTFESGAGGDFEWQDCGTGGAFSDSADPIVQNTITKDVHVGDGAGTLAGKLEIGGDADQPQLVIEGFSTQTDDIFIIQNDADTELFSVSNTGELTLARQAAPAIKFGDSDTTDSDVSAQIDANATDTGSGTEDIDLKISVQKAGVLTEVMKFDADGNTTTSNNKFAPSALIVPNGASPAATCAVGEVFIDTDETNDTNCTTTADNSLCICTATDTWTALENN